MVRKVLRWHCSRNHDHQTKRQAQICEEEAGPKPKFQKGDKLVSAYDLLQCLSFRRIRNRKIDGPNKAIEQVSIYSVVKPDVLATGSDVPGYRIFGMQYLLVSDTGDSIVRSQTNLSNDYLQIGPGHEEANRKSLYLRSHIVCFDPKYRQVLGEIERIVDTLHQRL